MNAVFLPDGNTMVPVHCMNVLMDALQDEYERSRAIARTKSSNSRHRLQHARNATLARKALKTLREHDACRVMWSV